jgi:SAM-dependent methyltransferase
MNSLPQQSVLDHYAQQASQFGLAAEATMPDSVVRRKEVEALLAFLGQLDLEHGRLLEIGCGNGYLMEQIESRFGARYTCMGIDATPEFIESARRRGLSGRFEVADLRTLPMEDNSFDVVISERVIINLLDPEDQMQCFGEVARVLRPGGYFAAIEGFKAGLENLNRARSEFLLPPIPEPPVNNWFTGERWQSCLAGRFRPMPVAAVAGLAPSNFLSSHYFMTRFVHDAIRPAEGKVRNTEFAAFFAAALPPVGDYSPLRIHYLERIR